MNEFWSNIGPLWWLIFPIAGLIGAAAKRWDVLAGRRHKRRLEILDRKQQIAAAKTGNVPVSAASGPQPITKPSPIPDQLEKLFVAHDDVTHRWLEYQLDVAKMIDFPAMSDGRQPLTASFIKAKRVADNARPVSATAKVSPDDIAAYRAAVTDYEVAFDLAERDARRQSTSGLSDAERKRLATAKQLLATATDPSATPAERQSAYRRVRVELDGLLSLSDEAVERLEKKVALELPAATRPLHTPPAEPSA